MMLVKHRDVVVQNRESFLARDAFEAELWLIVSVSRERLRLGF